LNNGRITEFDGLRGIAIALVLGCHYKAFATLLGGLPAYGWVGVDVFFVLSGFIITTILIKMRHIESPYKIFYIRRILRIFPIYFLVFTCLCLVSLFSKEHLIGTNFLVKNIFFLQSFVYTPAVLKTIVLTITGHLPFVSLWHHAPLAKVSSGYDTSSWAGSFSHTWSLSVEEFFYVFWAPVILQLSKRSFVRVAICVFLAAPLIRFAGFLGLENGFEFFSRVDMLMAGSLMSIWMQRRSSMEPAGVRRIDRAFTVAGLGSVVALAVLLISMRPFLGFEIRDDARFTVFGLSLFAIAFASGMAWILRRSGSNAAVCRFLRIKPLQFIGEISYCLYIIHIPVYVGVSKLARHFDIRGNGGDLVVALISLILAIMIAQLSWTYFETPMIALKDRWAPSVSVIVPPNSNN
jgi:peptidoglycan/LPS O-acetylase OafA/YrhL